MPGRIVFRRMTRYGLQGRVAMNAWAVPRSAQFPLGVKIRFVYLEDLGDGEQRVYGIDNEHGKGLHEHLAAQERALPDADWEDVVKFFFVRLDGLLRSGKAR